jgi:hypothetical protein
MTSKTFTSGTVIDADWLNDVNTATYTTVPALGTSTNTTIASLNNANGVGFGITPTGGINASIQTKDGIRFPATAVTSTDPNTLDRYAEGTFTGSCTGMTTVPTGTFSYTIIGNIIHLTKAGGTAGTSSATTFTITGSPSTIWPSAQRALLVPIFDNGGNWQWGYMVIDTAGVMNLYKDPNLTPFTSTGTKGLAAVSVTYML